MFFETNLGGGGGKSYYSGVINTPKNTHIDCGFKPKIILWCRITSNKSDVYFVYNEDISTTQYELQGALRNMSASEYLASVDSTGFSFGSHSSLTNKCAFLVTG